MPVMDSLASYPEGVATLVVAPSFGGGNFDYKIVRYFVHHESNFNL